MSWLLSILGNTGISFYPKVLCYSKRKEELRKNEKYRILFCGSDHFFQPHLNKELAFKDVHSCVGFGV